MDTNEKTQNSPAVEELIKEAPSKDQELTETKDDSIAEEFVGTHNALDDYRTELKQLIESEVINIMDEEIKKAKLELLAEQKKAIIQVVEEHKSIIRELVEEEKKTIWDKAEELRKSILRFGL